MSSAIIKHNLSSIFPLIVAIIITFPLPSCAIDYIESSNGLTDPRWEGGRSEFEMVDVNADGNIDIVSVGDHGSPYINTQIHGIMVYFGDGCGAWNLTMNGYFGYGGIAAGDCNNDGFVDLGYGIHHEYGYADFGDQYIEVALNGGTGVYWIPWDDNLASQGEEYGMFAADFGDIDNDGDLDIACTSFGYGNDLMIYRNQMDGTWEFAADLTGGNTNMVVQFGDINNDGNTDVATAYQNGNIYFGTGTGHFYNADYNLPAGGFWGLTGLSLGDVDNNGGMDLAYIANGGVNVWLWDDPLNLWVDASGSLPATGGYEFTQLCDMNADGFCDVAAGGTGRVTIWTGGGAGNWTQAASYTILNDPDCDFEAFRAGGDVDNNGYPDIVHLTDEGGWINSYNHLRLYKESSAPSDLSIMAVYPHGNENLLGGSVRFIDWLSGVPQGDTAIVDLEFSSNGVNGPWETIAAGIPNNGRYQWIVPFEINSGDCYIRYTAASPSGTVQAVNPAPFSIFQTENLASIFLTPVNPPIVIPAEGGAFEYQVDLTNIESISCSFDAWIDVVMPDSAVIGPLLLRQGMTLTPGAYIFREMTQNVPGAAPAGTYTYRAYIGVHFNDDVWAEDSFTFEKSAIDKLSDGDEEWKLTGWDAPAADVIAEAPTGYTLFNAYPNPFNAETTIEFHLPFGGLVNLSIYNSLGRKVSILVNEYLPAGEHHVNFNGRDLPSGIYFYAMEVNGFKDVKKMALVR
ncbi:MAG: T9SS type A sorting domain-containing protein [candidate division Zixibacteria bacterium]|nr:T9SS type A sorting domain-containing protein [Candidatus Tariuqbacter arcticus]